MTMSPRILPFPFTAAFAGEEAAVRHRTAAGQKATTR
jgi:hypothetical protein